MVAMDNNRIKFAVRDWKQMVAFKTLASRVREVMTEIIRRPQKQLSHQQRRWMEMWQDIFGRHSTN